MDKGVANNKYTIEVLKAFSERLSALRIFLLVVYFHASPLIYSPVILLLKIKRFKNIG
jgi:hypothetical protein